MREIDPFFGPEFWPKHIKKLAKILEKSKYPKLDEAQRKVIKKGV